ncbi:MAG: hypothetical protein U0235_34720 [Polyangiaceae bacterium]
MTVSRATPVPWKAITKAAAAITLAFAAFMLLVHLPAGRRLLAPFYAAKCPVTHITAAEAEAARVNAVKQTAGTGTAPERPALGFTLDKTTASEVKAWAARASVSCTDEREGALIKCTKVPTSALPRAVDGPPLSEVVFMFEPRGMTLVNLTAYLADAPETVAATRLRAVRDALRASLGPGTEVGELDAAYFNEDARTATVGYRFADYHADVTATRLRPGQVMVREHYLSARAALP